MKFLFLIVLSILFSACSMNSLKRRTPSSTSEVYVDKVICQTETLEKLEIKAVLSKDRMVITFVKNENYETERFETYRLTGVYALAETGKTQMYILPTADTNYAVIVDPNEGISFEGAGYNSITPYKTLGHSCKGFKKSKEIKFPKLK